MAESDGVGEHVGTRMGRTIDLLDHPLLFALAMTLIVFAFANLLYYAFVRLGWTGAAMFFR